jgi:hypothetical protein
MNNSTQRRPRAIGRERSNARVRLARRHDSEHWTRHFRCSKGQLETAVSAVGVDPIDVAVYLERICL